jgi:hypothetical protein
MNYIDIHVDVARTDGRPDNHLMDVFLAIHHARFHIDHWTRVPGGRWEFGVSYAGVSVDVDVALCELFQALGQPTDLLEHAPVAKFG